MKYANSAAFRMALGDRLKNLAAENAATDLDRLRKAVATERFLARLLVVAPDRWLLKGGVSLDYRLADRARTTLDVDIESQEAGDQIVTFVQHAATVDLGDYLNFSARQRPLTLADDDAAALRFRIDAAIGGRRFETTTLDVGMRGSLRSSGEKVVSRNLLEFAGIHPVEVPAITLEQHLAEKLHAYSRIYAHGRPSSRVKDLVDIVLIASEFEIEAAKLRAEIDRVFGSRKLHEQPSTLPQPPSEWSTAFRQMVGEVGLDPNIDVAFAIAAAFFDPVLSNAVARTARWNPEVLEWDC